MLTKDSTSKKRGKKSDKEAIIDFANEIATPIRSTEGRLFIVMKNKKHLAIPLSGTASPAISELCYRYYLRNNKWVGKDGMSHLSSYLTAKSYMAEPIDVHLRSAVYDGSLYLDCGNQDGHVIRIDSQGFTKLQESPVVFTRSAVTASLPDITDDSSRLHEILRFIRVSKEALPVLVGTIIGMWLSNIPQPIVLLHGSAGAGKTTSLRFILDLVDPSTRMPGGSLTEKVRDLKSLAVLRRVLVFDNASHVNSETSDHLARVATGGEIIMCSLYENDTPHTTVLMRPVILTAIMDGFTRSDLSSRAISFELPALSEMERTAFTQLEEQWEEAKPYIFTSLLNLTSKFLCQNSSGWLMATTKHRNLDLMAVIAFVSAELGIDGLSYVDESISALSDVVINGSVVGEAFRGAIECERENPEGCVHSGLFTMDGEKKKLGLFNRELNLMQLREVLEDHIPFEKRRLLPETAKQLGEAIKRIESDISNIYAVHVSKKHTNKGVRYTLSQKECNERVSVVK